MKRRQIRQRPKKIIENLPDSTLQEYLRALVDLRDKNENAIYKVDLALAIIKRHPKVNVTKLCSSIMNTENLFDLMAEYLDDEFKKYGFNLHDFYNSNHRQIDCPLLHHNLPCPNIRLYSPDEGTAIQRALAFLEDAARYPTKSAIKVENQNLGQDQGKSQFSVITDPQWIKMQAEAELGTTWIDQVYNALGNCFIRKVILDMDEYEGEVKSLDSSDDDDGTLDDNDGTLDHDDGTLDHDDSTLDDDDSILDDDDSTLDDNDSTLDDNDGTYMDFDELSKKWKGCNDGVLCRQQPQSIQDALSYAYDKKKSDTEDKTLPPISAREHRIKMQKKLINKIKIENLVDYLEKRCDFDARDLRYWGYSGKLLKKLIKEYLNSIDIMDPNKPDDDTICRPLTVTEKAQDPLYKFHPHDKKTCLHFILSAGMWGQKVEDFMRDSGHSLTPYDYNDLVVKFLLDTFTPSSSRAGLKKINVFLHLIYSDKYRTTQKMTFKYRKTQKINSRKKLSLQNKLVESFKANRFSLEWNEFYDKYDEQLLMEKIKDGCLA